MLASSPGLLPPHARAGARVTRIHSVAGLLPPGRPLVRRPPLRAPTTAPRLRRSRAAGPVRGPERQASPIRASSFSTSSPSSRSPRSKPFVSRWRTARSRSRGSPGRRSSRPAPVLVATMNLCPCGARRSAAECSCSPQRLAAYRELSRALLDRIDLVVQMPRERSREWNGRGESSAVVRSRVEAASVRLREEAPAFGSEAERCSRAVDTLPLSARGRTRVARMAVTIAALARVSRSSPSTSPKRSHTARRPSSTDGRDDRSARDAAYPPLLRRSTIRPRAFTCAAKGIPTCSRVRASPSSVRAAAPGTGRGRADARASWRPQALSS